MVRGGGCRDWETPLCGHWNVETHHHSLVKTHRIHSMMKKNSSVNYRSRQESELTCQLYTLVSMDGETHGGAAGRKRGGKDRASPVYFHCLLGIQLL